MNKIWFRHITIGILVAVMLFGVAIGATSVSAQSADGEVAVSPPEVTVEQGESKTIAVTYERLSDATPQGLEYSLTYDPAVVSVTDQEQGSYLGGDAIVNDISTPGEVEYAEVKLDGGGVETTNGTVATITVEPAADVDDGATTEFEFTTAKASEGATEFTITTINGTAETDIDRQTGETSDDDSQSDDTSQGNDDDSQTDAELDESEETQNDTESDDSEESQDDTESDDTDHEATTDATTNESDTVTDDDDSETAADDSIPGFGIILAVTSITVVGYLTSRREF